MMNWLSEEGENKKGYEKSLGGGILGMGKFSFQFLFVNRLLTLEERTSKNGEDYHFCSHGKIIYFYYVTTDIPIMCEFYARG